MERAIPKYVHEAKQCLLNQNYGKSYAFFLLVLKLCPRMQSTVNEGFIASWREWSTQLRELGRIKDLFSMYEQGCEVFMECDMLHFHMGNALFHLNMKLEAINMFRKSLFVNAYCFEASISLENACRGVIDSWHFAMLNDKKRNFFFDQAIRNSTKEDEAILDIGSGTGILSMVAVKHGARVVHACEVSKAMHAIAKECLTANEMEEEVNLLCCHSSKICVDRPSADSFDCHNVPGKYSLIISETVDAGVLGEGIVDTLSHAWKHLLLPPTDGGRVVPHSACMFCCLVESEEIHRKHVMTGKLHFPRVLITSGVGFSSDEHKNGSNGQTVEANDCFRVSTCDFEPYTSEPMKNVSFKALSDSKQLMTINFNDPDLIETIANERHRAVELDLVVAESGCADAIVVWFDLALESTSNSTVIHTGIGSSHCWEQAIYPLRFYESGLGNESVSKRLKVQPSSDRLKLSFQVRTDCLFLETVALCRDDQDGLFPQPSLGSCHSFHIALREEEMQRLNDSTFSNLCFRALVHSKLLASGSSAALLDISNGFDLFAMKTAQTSNMSVYKYCQTPNIFSALEELSSRCQVDIKLFNQLSLLKKHRFDVILLHFVEPSGLISPNASSNLSQVKSCLSRDGLILPNRVTLTVQCVESQELLSKCLVVSDQNTLGLKIADIVNDFRVSVHSDLDADKLEYDCLADPFEILTWDLNGASSDLCNAHKSIVVEASNSGTLHAILFWFKINVYGDDCIDTSASSNHWKQAAYVFPFDKQLAVTAGEEIVLKAICRDDSILFRASKYGS